MEEIDISFNKSSELPNDKGKINMHNKKNDIANHDLFVLNKYPLHSLAKNKINNLVNFYTHCIFYFIKF